jgi:phage gpG-like protein
MKMAIELEGFEELYDALINAPRKAEISVARVLNFMAQSTAQRAKNRIRSGARSGNIYTHTGTPHVASAPGEPPANLSGALAASITFTKITDKIESGATVGSSLSYAGTLEDGGWTAGDFGTVFVEARPFLRPSLEEAVAEGIARFAPEFQKEFAK